MKYHLFSKKLILTNIKKSYTFILNKGLNFKTKNLIIYHLSYFFYNS